VQGNSPARVILAGQAAVAQARGSNGVLPILQWRSSNPRELSPLVIAGLDPAIQLS
jgi:hypothetical protein